MSPRRVAPVLGLAAVLLLAGCGGGNDFSGKATVPSGYATYHGDRVSLAYPKDWQVAQRKDSDGGSSVRITPKRPGQTPYGLILLDASPNAAKRYEQTVKDRRLVMKQVVKAKLDSDDKVDLPGAKEAHRLTATAPARGGSAPAEVKSDSLDILRKNGDTLTVVVAAPQRKGDKTLDPKAVIDSVRLG